MWGWSEELWRHLQTSYGPHCCVIFVRNNSQISCKISDFGHHLCTGNGVVVYCNERHILLLACSIPFIRCIRMINRDSDIIYNRLTYGPCLVISAINSYTISCNISYFRHPLRMGNVRMCYKERHIMLLKCWIVSRRYIRMNRRDPVRIYNPHFVHTLSFLLK